MHAQISYPYLPDDGSIKYVSADDPFMNAAKGISEESFVPQQPIGSVIVKDGVIIGHGANGNDYHEKSGCERVRQNMPTGQGYELCEGCHPKDHSEPTAIRAAQAQGHEDLSNAEIYLWGHWWCCESCWNAMLSVGIHVVHLLEDSEILFNKDAPGNILPKIA